MFPLPPLLVHTHWFLLLPSRPLILSTAAGPTAAASPSILYASAAAAHWESRSWRTPRHRPQISMETTTKLRPRIAGLAHNAAPSAAPTRRWRTLLAPWLQLELSRCRTCRLSGFPVFSKRPLRGCYWVRACFWTEERVRWAIMRIRPIRLNHELPVDDRPRKETKAQFIWASIGLCTAF